MGRRASTANSLVWDSFGAPSPLTIERVTERVRVLAGSRPIWPDLAGMELVWIVQ